MPHAFSVLGNHDYKGDALAQFSPVLRKIDSRFICMRSFIVNAGANFLYLVQTRKKKVRFLNILAF